MDIFLTLVVKPDTAAAELSSIQSLAEKGIFENGAETTVLHEDIAVDLIGSVRSLDNAKAAAEKALGPIEGLDWCIQRANTNRRKKMIIADMDSTMITIECIDELADFVGLKSRVAEITEAAMRGELDFEAALKERVALLKGLNENDLSACYQERVKIMPGAKSVLTTMNANGAYSALVSGGFTYFTDRVSAELGFKTHRSNQLEIKEGVLTGGVKEPICGAEAKLEALNEFCAYQNIKPEEVLAVGDGANDIPMLEAAGMGVAYHAKPKTIAAASASIRYNDLRALLYFQGYKSDEIADVG